MSRILIVLLFFVCSLSTTMANTVTWVGNTSSDWQDTANWDCNCLPDADDAVILPIGSSVDLGGNSTVTIKNLVSRGILFIEEGSTLSVNPQSTIDLIGVSLILGSVINEGTLHIEQVYGAPGLSVSLSAALVNNGLIELENIGCEADDEDCNNLQDAVSIDGSLTQSGQLVLRDLRNMDGFVFASSFTNEGNIIGENLLVNGSALVINRATEVHNAEGASIQLTEVDGSRLTRAIQNILDSATIRNAGVIDIELLGQEVQGIALAGTGTRFFNSGTVNVSGGKDGMSLRGAGTHFENSGQLSFAGQSGMGLSLRSDEMIAINSGDISFQEGNAKAAMELGIMAPGLRFENRGTITVQSYIENNGLARGINVYSGALLNTGEIILEGSGQGRGIEFKAAAAPFEQPANGALKIDHFKMGLQWSVAATNYGTLTLGSNMGRGIVDTNEPLVNYGTLAGGSRFDDGTLDLSADCSISPGADTQTGTIRLGADYNLDNSVAITLDIAATQEHVDDYDRVEGLRSLNFSGEITVRLLDRFSLSSGTFTLLKASGSAGGLTGSPMVVLPDPPAGSSWRLEQTSTRLNLHLDLINKVDEVNKASFAVYPNPVSGGGVLQVPVSLDTSVTHSYWYNTHGQLVAEQAFVVGQHSTLAPNAPAGIYTLLWQTSAGYQQSRVVIE